ncbi:heterokaryon incompatibility protein-domain-containing protein [Xylariaceae sp. FL0255]|nr:heterokaryon incompatibility protein-domain-containing protein [Xylariaceae sp. FL0255]
MSFIHSPLPYKNGARYIRLVTLLPGTGDLRLQFQHQARRLGDHAAKPFEALSYVWGSEDNPLEVEVIVGDNSNTKPHNESHRQTISITRNLATALHNLKKKSQQVAFIGEVYKHTREVIVWLGPPSNNSSCALEVMGEIGSQITVDWQSFTMSPSPTACNVTLGLSHKPFPSCYTADDTSAIEALCARPWFERVWVRQEVALGRRAVFQAGHDCLDRALMQNAAHCIYHKDIEKPIFTGKDDEETILEGFANRSSMNKPSPLSRLSGSARMWLVKAMCQPPFRFFPVWLHYNLEGMHCGNPRDRVYGMLSLLRGLDNENTDFIPNYLTPVADCYRDLALRHITAERSLSLLATCSRSYKTLATARELPKLALGLPGLPSWVPDWSVDSDRHLCSSPIMCGQPFLALNEYLGDGVLRVTGVCCGTISVTSVVDVHSTSFGLLHSLWTACQDMGIPSPHLVEEFHTSPVEGESWATNLSRVLMADRFSESFEPHDPDIPSQQTATTTIERIMSLTNADFSGDSSFDEIFDISASDITFLLKSFRGKLAGRKLFRTSDGHVGVGPAYMQTGDRICLLLGSEFLIVLRPQNERNSASSVIRNEDKFADSANGPSVSHVPEQFLVVGECFVPGFMAAEPLLVNRRTGEVTLQDPRIQTLEHRLSDAILKTGTAEAVTIRPCDQFYGEQGELRLILS